MSKPTGFIIYEGASVLDGAPIVAIATLKTSNRKTGAMIQTWILRADMHPVEASKTGADVSICGSCPHRHNLKGACYVNIGQAPGAIYRAYLTGRYPNLKPADLSYFRGRTMRLGAYGDPAAVPIEIWHEVLRGTAGYTGYTHQANHKNFDPKILELCMVSADTPRSAAKARLSGARTFRVKTASSPLMAGEIECKADSAGITCEQCMLCHGSSKHPSIAINVHGSRSVNYADKFEKVNLTALGV